MERVLVVSGSERGREFLRELLRGQEYGQGFFADNSGEARRRMAEDDFSLVIINAPLRDESGGAAGSVGGSKHRRGRAASG